MELIAALEVLEPQDSPTYFDTCDSREDLVRSGAVARERRAVDDDDEEERPKGGRARKIRDEDDDEEEDRPSKGRRRDDDDDDRPKSRRRDDDDENEEEDRPKKRKKVKGKAKVKDRRSLGELRDIAIYQKAINFFILIAFIYGAFLALVKFGKLEAPEVLLIILAIAISTLSFATSIVVLLFAMEDFGAVAGLALGVVTLIPTGIKIVSLILKNEKLEIPYLITFVVAFAVLLMVNAKATKILRSNDVRVGMLGVKMSNLR